MANVLSTGFNNQTGRYEQCMSDGTVRVRVFVALDVDGEEIGTFETHAAAAGACQDAANESNDAEYHVEERWIELCGACQTHPASTEIGLCGACDDDLARRQDGYSGSHS